MQRDSDLSAVSIQKTGEHSRYIQKRILAFLPKIPNVIRASVVSRIVLHTLKQICRSSWCIGDVVPNQWVRYMIWSVEWIQFDPCLVSGGSSKEAQRLGLPCLPDVDGSMSGCCRPVRKWIYDRRAVSQRQKMNAEIVRAEIVQAS